MTGFGVGRAPYAGGHVAVEARSVNHRYLEVRVRLPAEVSDQAFFVEQAARQRLERGRFDIAVQLEGTAASLSFDRDKARALYRELSVLRDELAPGTELPLSALSAFSDLLTTSSSHDSEAFRQATTAALDGALEALARMRESEGARLGTDIGVRLDAIATLAERVAARAPAAVAAQGMRLRERVARLLEGSAVEVDPGRLETEIALLADRGDIEEEVVRIRSHIAEMRSALAETDPVGKRLDFLVQELAREANTIGSKSQDSTCSHLAVELKAELSRIREQVQNVE